MDTLFRLRVSGKGSETKLLVEQSPLGQAHATLHQLFSTQDQSALLDELEAQSATSSLDAAKKRRITGQQLFSALLPASAEPSANLLAAFQAAMAEAQAQHKPLALQLWFDPDSVEQAQLPWELLHNGSCHLVLSEDIHLNRYITYYGDREPFPPVGELRILFVISRPTDLAQLDDYAERNVMIGALRKHVEGGKIAIDVLEEATFQHFRSKLKSADYHVVHFDGHGGFPQGFDQGVLAFERSDGKTHFVLASQVAQVVSGSGIRLVVLSACQSGMVRGNTVLNSVGPALIRARVPAVVAMQFSIPMGATMAFTREFYASLARGESVSAAVADGRRAMVEPFVTWFFPALYLRAAEGEGYLFAPEPEEHYTKRMIDLAKLRKEWDRLPPEKQDEYDEGPPMAERLQEFLDLLDKGLDVANKAMDLAERIEQRAEPQVQADPCAGERSRAVAILSRQAADLEAEYQRRLEEVEAVAREVDQELARHDEAIREANNRLAPYDQAMQQADAELRRHEQKIQEMNQKVAEHDRKLKEVTEKAAQLDRKVEQAKVEAAKLDQRFQKAEAELARRKQEWEKTQAKLRELEHTASEVFQARGWDHKFEAAKAAAERYMEKDYMRVSKDYDHCSKKVYMPAYEARSRFYEKTLNPAIAARDKYYAEVVNPTYAKRNDYIEQHLKPANEARDRYMAQHVTPAYEARNNYLAQAVTPVYEARNRYLEQVVNPARERRNRFIQEEASRYQEQIGRLRRQADEMAMLPCDEVRRRLGEIGSST